MKIVFFGTPLFAAEVLRDLLQHDISVVAVVTQPDRPKGRSLQMTASPVKAIALEASIPIFQPEKASDAAFVEAMVNLKADLFVVVAFGQILSQKLLDVPPLGCINVHASLLPKYRGAAPIQRCLIDGEKQTGIAIQKMVKQLDAGDVIAVSKVDIDSDMTFGELEKLLIEQTKGLLLKVIHEYEVHIPMAAPQDHALATYASKIEPSEGQINWDYPAEKIHNLIRAFSPKPGAWSYTIDSAGDKKRLKILRSKIVTSHGKSGVILSPECVVACGTLALQLIEVQPEGKKAMKAADWLRGQRNILFCN